MPVGDGDGNGLGIGEASVGNLDLDVVDVVAARIGYRFEVWRRYKGQYASHCIDGEFGGVGATDNRKSFRCSGVGIYGDNRGNRRIILYNIYCSVGASAI